MKNCIDAGREGCPCVLADSGDCLICSRLNGESCDDCSWQGACIYTLYEQNGRKPTEWRQARRMNIVKKRTYGASLVVFVLDADYGFCQKAAEAGAYVFVSGENGNSWFEMPVSVLKSEPEKQQIHLGICGCGPKSKALLNSEGALTVRGVYRNGLSGMNSLYRQPDRAIVYGKGIAMAPFRNFLDGGERYVRYLKNMQFFVDLDKVGLDFFRDYFGDLPVDSIRVCDFSKMDFRKSEHGKRENVLALTSPYYVSRIKPSCAEGSGFVYPVPGNFCCGEGVCGACTETDEKGCAVRMCKEAK